MNMNFNQEELDKIQAEAEDRIEAMAEEAPEAAQEAPEAVSETGLTSFQTMTVDQSIYATGVSSAAFALFI